MRKPIGISFTESEVAAIDDEIARVQRQQPFAPVNRSTIVRTALAAALPISATVTVRRKRKNAYE